MKTLFLIISLVLLIAGVAKLSSPPKESSTQEKQLPENLSQAVFAGGCFWCMEAAFEALDGVYNVTSGYTGGSTPNPTYEEVSRGTTGHHEAVLVEYDSSKITFRELVDYYWRNIDPYDAVGQFADKGSQYTTAIFYETTNEKKDAEESLNTLQNKYPEKQVQTKILPREPFYQAEVYHQDYYKKRTAQYNLYKVGSGRESKLKQLWGEK